MPRPRGVRVFRVFRGQRSPRIPRIPRPEESACSAYSAARGVRVFRVFRGPKRSPRIPRPRGVRVFRVFRGQEESASFPRPGCLVAAAVSGPVQSAVFTVFTVFYGGIGLMKSRSISALCGALLAALLAFQAPGAAQVRKPTGVSAITQADLKEWLTYIASDQLQGRPGLYRGSRARGFLHRRASESLGRQAGR